MYVLKEQVGKYVSPLSGRLGTITLLAALLSGLPTVGLAQENLGAAVNLGDSRFYPSVRVDYLQNDNAYLTSTHTESASGVTVAPTMVWRAD